MPKQELMGSQEGWRKGRAYRRQCKRP